MSRGQWTAESGIERAALAYSLLPVRYADAVNLHFSIAERQRLREGLARVRDASDYARIEAIRALGMAVRRGVVFPRPPGTTRTTARSIRWRTTPDQVIDLLERLARRDAFEVVVTLCHLPRTCATSFGTASLGHQGVLPPARLAEVPLVRPARTASTPAT